MAILVDGAAPVGELDSLRVPADGEAVGLWAGLVAVLLHHVLDLHNRVICILKDLKRY